MNVISVRGYTWPAPTIASDLAQDIKDSSNVPEAARKQFEVGDEAAQRRANNTAAQWVASLLQPETGELVAVIVLLPEQSEAVASTEDSSNAAIHHPFFILIKARADEARFRITQIAYGDAAAALK
jgi:hypothetical protein